MFHVKTFLSIQWDIKHYSLFQVYMFTATGLHDKPNNYQTQFAGVLLRPKDFLSLEKNLTEQTSPALTNGHAK